MHSILGWVCIVRSGVSNPPLDITSQILYGVQVSGVRWPM